MYRFESFGLRQMIESSRDLRQLGSKSLCMEEAAREIVDFFFDSFQSVHGVPECALVRCFKTHRYGELPATLRTLASAAMHGETVEEVMPCLTLLATRGVEEEWNSRHGSVSHHVIPLATAEMVSRAPMIARLVQQMGLQLDDILDADVTVQNLAESRALDVFHVEEAAGSQFVPAQEQFVRRYGVRSVLGFGGMFPTGELFFVLLFTVSPISAKTAAMFRTLALCIKLVLLHHLEKPVFAA